VLAFSLLGVLRGGRVWRLGCFFSLLVAWSLPIFLFLLRTAACAGFSSFAVTGLKIVSFFIF